MTGKVKPRAPMTHERLLSLQMTAGQVTMTILCRLLNDSKPSDAQWVEQVNKLAEQIAALATLALDAEPPAELEGAYHHWRDCVYSWHRAVSGALDAFKADVVSGTTNRQAWQIANRREKRGWRSYNHARRELQRVQTRRMMASQAALSASKIDVVA